MLWREASIFANQVGVEVVSFSNDFSNILVLSPGSID